MERKNVWKEYDETTSAKVDALAIWNFWTTERPKESASIRS